MANRVDSFNRADSTTALGTPSDGGSAWVANSGTWGILNNKAYLVGVAANSVATLESSVSNVTVSANIYGVVSTDAGLICRLADDNNYILAAIRFNGQCTLFSKVAGVYTQIGITSSYTFVDGDLFSLSADSSNLITLKQNGSTLITATDSTGSANTKHGIRRREGTSSTNTFEDFSITEISALRIPVISNTRRDL